VGTTLAPWQLFFQQPYVIDPLTPRFINYEKVTKHSVRDHTGPRSRVCTGV